MRSSATGPSAPWVEDDDPLYEHVLHRVEAQLKARLVTRIGQISRTGRSADELMDEIRRQISECGAEGDVLRAADLSELALELAQATSDRTRFM